MQRQLSPNVQKFCDKFNVPSYLRHYVQSVEHVDTYADENRTITMKDRDWDVEDKTAYKNERTEHLSTVARYMNAVQFSNLLDNFLNVGGKREQDGFIVGLMARRMHRTLQGNLMEFLLGVIRGLSYQEHSDARNESALRTAKQITQDMDDGRYERQRYI